MGSTENPRHKKNVAITKNHEGSRDVGDAESSEGSDSEPEITFLNDLQFDTADGLANEIPECDLTPPVDISLENVSRLLIERGFFPPVPINFEYPSGLVTRWSEWVDYELQRELARDRLTAAGVLASVFASARCEIYRDVTSLRHLVRRWNPHTHTFVCSWGEFTPTLEDVLNIMRLPIIGSANPFDFERDPALDWKLDILKAGASDCRSKRRFANWVKFFWGSIENGKFKQGKGFDLGCRLEAMLALWLTKFVFIEFSFEHVEQRVFPLAIAIAAGTTFPLAPLFLGQVYRLLDCIVEDEIESAGSFGITTFVNTSFLQVFVWERFSALKVEPLTGSLCLEMYRGSKKGCGLPSTSYLPLVLPLQCRWFRRKQSKSVFTSAMWDDESNFAWQPYLHSSDFETFSFSGKEDQGSTALGRAELYVATLPDFIPSLTKNEERLVYTAIVYSPTRVRRQFGLLQGIPICPPLRLGSRIRNASPSEIDCIKNHTGGVSDAACIPGGSRNPGTSSDYDGYWTRVLYSFRQCAKIKGVAPGLIFNSGRLASHPATRTYASKHNLPYEEVWSDDTERTVGMPKSPSPGDKKKCKSRKRECSDGTKGVPDKKKAKFKPKVDFGKFMSNTPKVKAVASSTTQVPLHGKTSLVHDCKVGKATDIEKKAKKSVGSSSRPLLRRSSRVRASGLPVSRGPPIHLDLSDTEPGSEETEYQLDPSNEGGIESVLEILPGSDGNSGHAGQDHLLVDDDIQEDNIGGRTPEHVYEPQRANTEENIQDEPSNFNSCQDSRMPTEASASDLASFAEKPLSEWVTYVNDFMARFDSDNECSLGMDCIVPQLSGTTIEFEGMMVASEVVGPLTKFSEKYGEGKFLNLLGRQYTSKKKRELTEEFGMMLLSMEVCKVKNAETFLIWRDACRDFLGAGFRVDFLIDHLRQSSQRYFGYLMKPKGLEDHCLKVRGLQDKILRVKEELKKLEEELSMAESDPSLDLRGVPKLLLDHMLQNSWGEDSCFSHHLY